MPIDFQNTEDLTRAQRLFANPTGWGDTIVRLIGDSLARFGSASLRDSGTAGGQIPLVDADGSIAAVIADATATGRGLVTRNQVTTIASATEAIRMVLSVIGAGNLGVREPGVQFVRPISSRRDPGGGFFRIASAIYRLTTADNASILLLGTDGGDAPDSGTRHAADRDGDIVLLSDTNNNDSTVRIYINSGGTDAPKTPQGADVSGASDGISHLDQSQLTAFGFAFGFVLHRWGSRGGARTPQAGADFGLTHRNRTVGIAGDLLVAYKPAAATIYYEAAGRSHLFRHPNPLDYQAGEGGFVNEILL